MSILCQGALKKALVHDGVARGLRECVKALDRRQAHLCILASDCDSAEYVRLVEALAQEHSINIIKGIEGKQLGEWVGLAKLDKEGKARKVRCCSDLLDVCVWSCCDVGMQSVETALHAKESTLLQAMISHRAFSRSKL